MKLSPLDIQQQRFPRVLLGADGKEVQTFLDFISREYGALLTEVQSSRERAQTLESELFRYREREETLKEALVSAQRMAEELKAQAKKESDLVLADAEMKAERIIHHAHTRLISILEEINDLKRQRIRMTESLRKVLSTHQKLLEHDQTVDEEKEEQLASLVKLPKAPPVPSLPGEPEWPKLKVPEK